MYLHNYGFPLLVRWGLLDFMLAVPPSPASSSQAPGRSGPPAWPEQQAQDQSGPCKH